jgi:hypothetical protein
VIITVNSHTLIKTLSSFDGYDVPQFRKRTISDDAVAWYATNDDRVLGVVLREPIDEDDEDGAPSEIPFAWMLLTRKPWQELSDIGPEPARGLPPGYWVHHWEPFCRTLKEAITELHAEMLQTCKEKLGSAIHNAQLKRFGSGFGEPYRTVDPFGEEALTRMSVTEAKEFGVADSERHRYYRLDMVGDHCAPAQDATWFRMDTADDVAEPWNPPSREAGG